MITLQIGGELSVWHCLVRIPLHCVSVRLAASVMITKTTFNLVLSAYSSKRSSLFSSLLIVCDRHVKIQLLTKFKNNCGKLIQSHLRIFTISEPMVDHLEQGWRRVGAVVRALASHQCGLGSIPGPGVICGLSLLLVLYSAPRGFSPGTPVFPSS